MVALSRATGLNAFSLGGESITTSVKGPTGQTPVNGSQLATRAANVKFFRACLASALVNNINPVPYMDGLRENGTSGS
jgi:hypothetical protein